MHDILIILGVWVNLQFILIFLLFICRKSHKSDSVMKSTLEIIVFINLRIKKKKIVLEDS